MDVLFEIILELIFEGGIEISSNKKISKWIRYPLIFIIALFFMAIIFLLIFIGIKILKSSLLVGIVCIALGISFLIGSVLKFRKLYLLKK